MNTCDTCKNYNDKEKTCRKAGWSLLFEPFDPIDNQFGSSDALGEAEFLCGPKFGCVHWQEKE